jgi:NADH-quinone oxidoreductase subunit G
VGRLLGGWLRGQGETGARAALDEIAGLLGSAAASEIGVVVSPDLPLEAQFAAKRFAGLFPGARVAGGSLRAPWVDDGILRKADRHPNSKGLEILGLAGGLDALLDRPPRVLVVFEEDLAGDGGEKARGALVRAESLVVLGSRRTATVEAARAALGACTYAEHDGTFVNFEGRLQRFRRALNPLGEARPVPEILADLAARLGKTLGWPAAAAGPEAVWSDLARATPALEGIRFAEIPDGGLPLDLSREPIASAGAAAERRGAP